MINMCSPIETANLNAVFGEIMRKKNLKPEEVEKNGTKMHIFSTGGFECPFVDCGHHWQSKFSWMTFNLKEMRIVKRWKMMCRFCHTECFPNFSPAQIKEMYEKAVTIYMTPKTTAVVDIGFGARRKFDQPHLPVLCEKCEWGAVCCWKGIFQ